METEHRERKRGGEKEMETGKNEVVVEVAKCSCCGMWEECTAEYIRRVAERFGGAWVCGLCAEAIKDEQARLGGGVGVQAAMIIHAKFREAACANPTASIAMSLLQLFKKTISSATATTNSAKL